MRILPRSPTGSCRRRGPCMPMVGGGATRLSPTKPSSVVCCERCFEPVGRGQRRYQLTAQQIQRRFMIKLDVVKGVRDDLGDPHQARLNVFHEEQLYGAEQ